MPAVYKTTIEFSEEVFGLLKSLSATTGKSRKAVIEDALKQYAITEVAIESIRITPPAPTEEVKEKHGWSNDRDRCSSCGRWVEKGQGVTIDGMTVLCRECGSE